MQSRWWSGGDYGGRGVGDGGGAWVAMRESPGRHPRRCHTSRRHPRAAALAAAVTTALLAPVALADYLIAPPTPRHPSPSLPPAPPLPTPLVCCHRRPHTAATHATALLPVALAVDLLATPTPPRHPRHCCRPRCHHPYRCCRRCVSPTHAAATQSLYCHPHRCHPCRCPRQSIATHAVDALGRPASGLREGVEDVECRAL